MKIESVLKHKDCNGIIQAHAVCGCFHAIALVCKKCYKSWDMHEDLTTSIKGSTWIGLSDDFTWKEKTIDKY